MAGQRFERTNGNGDGETSWLILTIAADVAEVVQARRIVSVAEISAALPHRSGQQIAECVQLLLQSGVIGEAFDGSGRLVWLGPVRS